MVIFHGVAVQNVIVLDWPQIPILFPNEEKGSSVGVFRGADIIAFSLFLEEFIKCIIFMLWLGVNLAVNRAWSVWEEINSMIPFS